MESDIQIKPFSLLIVLMNYLMIDYTFFILFYQIKLVEHLHLLY